MKTVVFIDGNYLYQAGKHNNKNIDFSALRDALESKFESDFPIKFYYYICTHTNKNDDHVPTKPLIDWLSYNGFIIRHKAIPESQLIAESRGFISCKMSLDAMLTKADHYVFCTNSSELVDLINQIGFTGNTTLLTSHTFLSHQDLRQCVDNTIIIEDLDKEFSDIVILKNKGVEVVG